MSLQLYGEGQIEIARGVIMRTRKLGNNGPELTVVGFGARAIGGP